jgi:hypothetical protein
MKFNRKFTLLDIPLMLMCAVIPLFFYHMIIVHHISEDRKIEPMFWLGKNQDLDKLMHDKYGIGISINTGIPGSFLVWMIPPLDNEKDHEQKALEGLNVLRDELFKRRCPYGVTLVSFQMDLNQPRSIFSH